MPAYRSRLTLELSSGMTADIAKCAEKRSCSKAHVLRIALDLLFAFEEAKDEGLTVGAYANNGDLRVEREFTFLH